MISSADCGEKPFGGSSHLHGSRKGLEGAAASGILVFLVPATKVKFVGDGHGPNG